VSDPFYDVGESQTNAESALRRGAAAQGAAESPPSRTWPPLPSLKRKDPAIQIVNDHHVTGHGEGGLRPSVETDIFEVPDDVCTHIVL
jgi:hypothetical protein